MPQIPQKNRRFRTKSQICSDLAEVLNSKTLHYGTQHAVLSEAMWVWTEFDGKYSGCKHWSEAAWRVQDQQKMLVHEHAVPKSIVIDRLRKLSNPTAESVNQLLEGYCKGAVLTRDEDKELDRLKLRSKMPPDWDEVDPWARYTYAGIVLRAHAS